MYAQVRSIISISIVKLSLVYLLRVICQTTNVGLL